MSASDTPPFHPPSDGALDLSGLLGVDFVNTIVRIGGSPVDLLATPEALSWWMSRAGGGALEPLLPHGWPDRRRLGREAVALRQALTELFGSVGTGSTLPSPAAFVVDRALRGAEASFRLDASAPADDTAFRPTARRSFHRRGSLAPLTPIALSAVETAASVDPSRLRSCDAPDCRRWFVDTSKGGRRRWCSMARCGNRMKAARYRERHG
ncbi:MAG: CGNR zinc finger domain-containing protein [Longimicrobiales bacterium]|nr:CGNR zinc finger domain-containing protein [Longimicrobiales bacterium]